MSSQLGFLGEPVEGSCLVDGSACGADGLAKSTLSPFFAKSVANALATFAFS